jgi:esterase/lipase superfamily enzyme
MTLFINLRDIPNGGSVADEPSFWRDGNISMSADQLLAEVDGRDVLFATHGFNVNRKDGVNALTEWESYFRFPIPMVFVGVLWPGDSAFLPVLDYPIEGIEISI